MYALPSADSPLREIFEIEDLVAIGTGERKAPTIPEARASARETFASSRTTSRVYFLAMRANDDIELISIGRQLKVRTEWKFTV
jgi:hypothetical protein